MGDAKDIVVRIISSKDAIRIVRSLHYSGNHACKSQLHFGVFLNGKCGGVLQFGPPIDRRKLLPLVSGTAFYNFLELNRMAMADWMPRNGESRVIAYCMKFIRKHYPHIDWIISFSDATQCGDGTIYRASGFELIGIKKNSTIWRLANGKVVVTHGTIKRDLTGGKVMSGFQLRYIYFLNKDARKNLTVPTIPFEEIGRMGAKMYRGISARSDTSDTPVNQTGKGGAEPTRVLSGENHV